MMFHEFLNEKLNMKQAMRYLNAKDADKAAVMVEILTELDLSQDETIELNRHLGRQVNRNWGEPSKDARNAASMLAKVAK